jgi:methyl-accepting chemotaxis protein
MHVRDFFGDHREIADLILKTLRERALVTNQAFEGTDARGESFFIKLDAAPVFDLEHKAMGCFVQLAVLTEVKRQEDRLVATNRVICETAEQAGDIAAQVAAAAAELSSVVEQTGRGMDVQKIRAGETATAMQQMNSTVLEVARNASGAAEQAELTMRKAREGADTVQQSVAAIGRVKTQTDILKDASPPSGNSRRHRPDHERDLRHRRPDQPVGPKRRHRGRPGRRGRTRLRRGGRRGQETG